jgi:GcrA cell cycle regulator
MSIWPEADAQLTALWLAGIATAEIGRALGVSKNAAVGRAHRLDLPSRPSPTARRNPLVPPKARRPLRQKITLPPLAPEPAPPLEPAAPPSTRQRDNVTTRQAPSAPIGRGLCQWPSERCDAPVVRGKPYCLEHCLRAFVGFKPPRESDR